MAYEKTKYDGFYWDEDETLCFVSPSGIVYELLEGTGIPKEEEKPKTSDIVFVVMDELTEDTDPNELEYPFGQHIVGFLYGCADIALENNGAYIRAEVRDMVSEWEQKNTELIESVTK